MKKRLFSFLLFLLLLLPLAARPEEFPAFTFSVSSIAKDDGGAVLDVRVKDFLKLGTEYGDTFAVTLPSGSMILSHLVPDLRDVPPGSYALYAPKTNLRLGYRGEESAAKVLDLQKGDSVTLTLIAPGHYRQTLVMNHLEAVEKRKDSPSDEAYANFRMVSGGNLLPGVLYRGTHPVNGEPRAKYMRSLMEQAGISFVLNLSDTPEDASEREMEGLYQTLYDLGLVYCAGMDDTDLTSPVFQQQLAASLTHLAFSQGPCLVHCIYGKDRTGMVCALLEAFCGASYAEIEQDYLLSYENWYQLTPEDEAYGYARGILHDWVCSAFGVSNPASEDLFLPAWEYLLSCGMEESVLNILYTRLTGLQAPLPESTPVPTPAPSPEPVSEPAPETESESADPAAGSSDTFFF